MPDTAEHNYTLSLFSPHVGSKFQLCLDGRPALDLTLVEAVSIEAHTMVRDPSIRAEPFSLIFHGPLTPYANQACYELKNSELGSMEIFLVPLGPDKPSKSQMQYQAIFN
jgi:hypothetical protein